MKLTGKTGAVILLVLAAFAFLAWQAEMKRRMYIQAAVITEALGVMNVAKMQVVTARDNLGKWPSSNEESGLPPASDYAIGAISQLRVSNGGVVTVTFNGKSGVKDGTICLTPHTGMDVRWKCTTPSFEGIEQWAPQCTYQK